MAEQPKLAKSPLTLILTLSAVFFAIFLMISGIFFLKHAPSKGTAGGGTSSLFSGGSVGIIELSGVIMDSKKMRKALEEFADDDDIKAVVLRLNSPGGAVAPSQEIYEAVRAFKKPLVASMGSVAASGAFYVACAAKTVFANPGTITGSIGVIMEFADLQKLLEWAKIHRYVIKTGKYKDVGAEYRDMTPEERALMQGMADNVLGQFKAAVAEGRKLPLGKVTAIADGRVFSGEQAKAIGLVDSLGGIDDAIREAGKLGKLSGKPNVVYPEKARRKLLDFLMDENARDDSESSETQLSAGAGILGRLLHAAAPALSGGLSGDALDGLAPGLYWLWTK
jgi:protease-4